MTVLHLVQTYIVKCYSAVSKNVHACCAEQSETSRYKHLSSSWFHNQSWNQIWYSFLKMLLFVTKQLRICHMTHFEFLSLHQWKKTPKHLFSYWLLKYRDFSTSEQWDWNKSVQLNIKSVCGGKQGEQECWNIPQGYRNAEKPGDLVANRFTVQSQDRTQANKCLPVSCICFEFKLWLFPVCHKSFLKRKQNHHLTRQTWRTSSVIRALCRCGCPKSPSFFKFCFVNIRSI